MAYIGKEAASDIRKALKKAYPNLKFSVRIGSGNYSLDVTLLKGHMDLSDLFRDDMDGRRGYCDVNIYHLGNYGTYSEFLGNVVRIMKNAPKNPDDRWYDKSDSMVDYFDTGYYLHLSIGRWDKPYECTKR
jgi:hypothetical protein